MRFFLLWMVLILVGWWSFPWLKNHVPAQWNPFTPLSVTDPPGWMTRYKLQRLSHDPAACMAVMQLARQQGFVQYRDMPAQKGDCPLSQPLLVSGFGRVALSSPFLASCPLAVSSTMFVINSDSALQQAGMTSPLRRIAHVGSYACRNIYHRQQGRRSEHATADAWDVSGFQLKDGRWLQVGRHWQQPPDAAAGLHALWRNGCATFGNVLGPDYNAAHAGHFHLGMRGMGYCR